jgi:hypothetical protein
VSETFTRHVADGAFGIVHGCVPSSGVLATTSVQLDPLFVEYSIRTFPLVPLELQVMLWLLPTCQFSPPLGELMVMKETNVIVNTALL